MHGSGWHSYRKLALIDTHGVLDQYGKGLHYFLPLHPFGRVVYKNVHGSESRYKGMGKGASRGQELENDCRVFIGHFVRRDCGGRGVSRIGTNTKTRDRHARRAEIRTRISAFRLC